MFKNILKILFCTCFTIAGQTAPGDGICITGYTLNIQASNIIIRYIRSRFGDANAVADDAMNCWSGNFQNITQNSFPLCI